MKYSFFILFIFLLTSCQESTESSVKTIDKTEMHTISKHQINTVLEKNNDQFFLSWKEYTLVSDKLEKFKSISANEALNNALQLSKLVKQLKDSIRPKDLLNNPFRTRINVLENEALRLKDMTYISSITSKEVNNQVTKIMEAFSATNSKINTVYSQLKIEKEIKDNSKSINSKSINSKKEFIKKQFQ